MIRLSLPLSLSLLRRPILWAVSVVMTLLLFACSSHFAASSASSASFRAQQAQTWQGEVSCPGCSERWLTVTLFPDGLFRLRETYVAVKNGSEERFYDVGRWSAVLSDSSRVQLAGASTRQLRLLPEGDLAVLDTDGKDIVSIREYHLKRLHKPDFIGDPMHLLVLYGSDDSGAVLTECLTAQVVSVADTPTAAKMRQVVTGISAERRARGPILATVTARWGDVVGKPESAGRRLLIEQFDRFWPNETCAQGPIAPAQPLVETVWQLVSVNAIPAQEAVLGQAAHIRLRKGGRLTGSTGCNRLQGNWQSTDDKLGLSRISSSRASCRDAMSQQEQAMLNVLRSTKQYRQVGHQLELLQDDQVLARFVATEML